DGPIRGRELPIDLEQLPDDLLFQVHTQAAEILSSRVDDALPGAVRDACAAAAPYGARPASVTFRLYEGTNGQLAWDPTRGNATFADGRTLPVDLGDDEAGIINTAEEWRQFWIRDARDRIQQAARWRRLGLPREWAYAMDCAAQARTNAQTVPECLRPSVATPADRMAVVACVAHQLESHAHRGVLSGFAVVEVNEGSGWVGEGQGSSVAWLAEIAADVAKRGPVRVVSTSYGDVLASYSAPASSGA
ncbi:hypothetical protein, partial [Streptomyces sp. 7N604]|uniref:hypothetical protein n=1 Tax=Streptomyces sp. 7N604 TaxID=3457415 RepID=UPI003FD47926